MLADFASSRSSTSALFCPMQTNRFLITTTITNEAEHAPPIARVGFICEGGLG